MGTLSSLALRNLLIMSILQFVSLLFFVPLMLLPISKLDNSVTLVLLFIHVLSFVSFLLGFFPSKHVVPGLATRSDQWDPSLPASVADDSEPRFKRLVFILIDALREDFVYSKESGMNFLQSLLNEGKAFGFIAHAPAPTVTLPRLKAITSGSLPTFLDVLSNFDDTQTLGMDSWPLQFHEAGKKMVFYGDDTWLKLFKKSNAGSKQQAAGRNSSVFYRYEGTTSFFVTDTVEVDNNVTRHLDFELENQGDWDALILHYLGLDHVGHCEGSSSSKMRPKQEEMDNVIRRLYEGLDEEHRDETLFVILGDHGMTNMGNHGGSTLAETSTALVLLSHAFNGEKTITSESVPFFPSDFVEKVAKELKRGQRDGPTHGFIRQVDLVPTLAELFGLPIPRNNIGRLITKVLENSSSSTFLIDSLHRNAKQVMNVWSSRDFGPDSKVGNSLFDDALSLHSKWIKGKSPASDVIKAYEDFLSHTVEILNHAVTGYHHARLISSLIISGLVVSLLLFWVLPLYFETGSSNASLQEWDLVDSIGVLITIAGFSIHWVISSVGSQFLLFRTFQRLRQSTVHFNFWSGIAKTVLSSLSNLITCSMFVFVVFSVFSSSLVEEEYLCWFYICTSLCLFEWLKKLFMRSVVDLDSLLLLFLLRFGQNFNSTGYQWVNDPSYSSFFNDHPIMLDILYCSSAIVFGYILIYDIKRREVRNHISYGVTVALALLSLFIGVLYSSVPIESIKSVFFFVNDSVWLGRSFYVTFILYLNRGFKGTTLSDHFNLHLLDGLVISAFIFQKKHNVILILLFHLYFKARAMRLRMIQSFKVTSSQQPWSISELLLYFSLSRYLFFALGQSNGIATIDISRSYVGLTDFQYQFTGFLTFFNTFYGPLFILAWTSELIFFAKGRRIWMKRAMVQLYGEDQQSIKNEIEPNGAHSLLREMTLKESVRVLTIGGENPELLPSLTEAQSGILLITIFNAFYQFSLMASCFNFRNHLFVWSVFSPKIMVESCWSFLLWIFVFFWIQLDSNPWLMDLIYITRVDK